MRAAIETTTGSGVPAAPVLDAQGSPLPGTNRYQAPIFEFLFPEIAGVGTPIVPNNFESFPFLAQGSGPLDPSQPVSATNPVVGQLNPWPLGFAAPVGASCPVPGAPVASAGANQTVASGASVTLQGSATGGTAPYTFNWIMLGQVGGTPNPVTFTQNATTGTLTFTAPSVAAGSPAAVLTFELAVTDAAGVASAATTVTVTVNPVAADVVAITLVEYRKGKQRLTVNATSTASTAVPPAVLKVQAFDAAGNPQLGTLTPQTMTLSGGVYSIILVGVPQPATVKVTSDHGGVASSGITRLRN
jgi:hypothetical protein